MGTRKLSFGQCTNPSSTIISCLILLQYKINPALLVMGGGIIGVLSFMPK